MDRRTLLLAGLPAAGMANVAGCASFSVENSSTLERIVLRTDTGRSEQIDLTLVYAPRDGSAERPVWGTFEAPASGETTVVADFDGDAGFYSLTAHAQGHDTLEVVSFNSHGDAVGGGSLQFEVVVREGGDVWTNLNDAGSTVSIPE